MAVNRGTFDAAGHVHWSAPTFIGHTTSPAIFNDKEWIAADHNPSSPFRDRIYVTFTRFVFNKSTGAYVQSPIMAAYSIDHGATFSDPDILSAPVIYSQGSRPVVGPDGTVYVFWDGSTRLASFDSTWMSKSADGGVTWSPPVKVADLADIRPPGNTAFRVNSYPAAAVAPNGDVYVAWSSQRANAGADYASSLCFSTTGCRASLVYSRSSDGGATWSAPQIVNPALDGALQTPIGYPAPGLPQPNIRRVDTDVAASPSGHVYVSYYATDVVSPWQTCKTFNPKNSMLCEESGSYIDNARLDYYVTDVVGGGTQKVTAQPVNSRYQFRGGFIGDYTGIAVGSDGVFHATYTDTNNVQALHWWFGVDFGGIQVHQQDIVTVNGTF